MSRRTLTDAQRARIEPFVPGKAGEHGRTAIDNRRFVDAILWLAHTAAPWRDLPPELGNWQTAHCRFRRWTLLGVWESLFKVVAEDPDFEYVLVDATIQHDRLQGACGRDLSKKGLEAHAIGRSKGGLTTKIHAVVDVLELPIRFEITPGQWGDSPQAQSLIAGLKGVRHVIADAAYDADYLRTFIADELGAVAKIKQNPTRATHQTIYWIFYKERRLVENFFNRIKRFRRIALRCEKTVASFKAFLI